MITLGTALAATARWIDPPACRYEIARTGLIRGMGMVYVVAFAVTLSQWTDLVGSDGLLPVSSFLDQTAGRLDGSRWRGFWSRPGLFWLCSTDYFMVGCASVGLVLAVAATVGRVHAAIMALLWALYFSFVTTGQEFYAYGWETMTLEAGFLAIFLCPIRTRRLFPRRTQPARAVLWFYRWLLFRAVMGAGLIKIRGDGCWRDLSCFTTFFETQPMPTSFSRWFHELPPGVLQAGVAGLLLVQLIAPWLILGSPRLRRVGGVAILTLQIVWILSGNGAWSAWLVALLCLPCFDDACFWIPGREGQAVRSPPRHLPPPSPLRSWGLRSLTVILLFLSLQPAWNLISPRQVMNRSYGRFRLVNSYGAFGNVIDVRHELRIEGTPDDQAGEDAEWLPYEFKAKPGHPFRTPPHLSPWHHRLDWQLWFAALGDRPDQHPWIPRLAEGLRSGDPTILRLVATNPFPNHPPTAIRIRRAVYRFAPSDNPHDRWWEIGPWTAYWPPLEPETTLHPPHFAP